MSLTRPAPKPAPKVKAPPTRPTRKKRIARSTTPIRAKRGKPRRGRETCPTLLAWIQQQPCCLTGVVTGGPDPKYLEGLIHACHVKTRGAMGPDLGNVIPMTWWLHDRQHLIGIKSFEREFQDKITEAGERLGKSGVTTLADLAELYTSAYLRETQG